MKIIDNSPTHAPFTRVKVTHGSESHEWDLSFYGNPNNATIDSVFDYVNRYFATLPTNRQSDIYDIYVKAKNYIRDIIDPNMLQMRLTKTVGELYKQIPFDEIRYWTAKHGNVRVPADIKDRYEDLEISERSQQSTNYKSRTYLRDDYLELANLAIILKPMIPIWAEYSKVLDKIPGAGTHREYQSMALLNKSHVIQSEPMEQLKQFVESAIPKGNKSSAMSAVLGGLGSSELPDWLMSMAIIRKLVIVELSSSDPNDNRTNLVGVMYQHVNNSFKSIDRKFSGRITNKPKPSSGDDEDNKSIIETYKIKQEISDGDLAVLSIYAENYSDMANRVDPTLPLEYVEVCIDRMKQLDPRHITVTPGQMILLRWIIAPALPPNSIDNVNKAGLIMCLSVTQAALWHWGYIDLALMLTGTETRDNNGVLLGGVESRTRIPKEYVEEFMNYYPHYSERGSRERERQTNVTCRAIDTLTSDLVKSDWVVRAPSAIIQQSEFVDGSGTMTVPGDIKTQLSTLVLKLVKMQEERYQH